MWWREKKKLLRCKHFERASFACFYLKPVFIDFFFVVVVVVVLTRGTVAVFFACLFCVFFFFHEKKLSAQASSIPTRWTRICFLLQPPGRDHRRCVAPCPANGDDHCRPRPCEITHRFVQHVATRLFFCVCVCPLPLRRSICLLIITSAVIHTTCSSQNYYLLCPHDNRQHVGRFCISTLLLLPCSIKYAVKIFTSYDSS